MDGEGASYPQPEALAAMTPDLSVVVPAHNEEQNLPALFGALDAVLSAADVSFELILVDDGSRDSTADVIRTLARRHPNVSGVLLSRNFGHPPAVSIGLTYATGSAVAVMDADLQDRPEDLLTLYQRWQEADADVVYAVRQNRKEGPIQRFCFWAFYRVLVRLSRIPIPADSGDFCVMSSAFVRRLNELPERLRFVRGLRAWLGGKQVACPVDRGARHAGETQYSFASRVRFAIEGIVTFSDAPLRMASLIGLMLSAATFLGAVVVLVWKFTGRLPSGAGVATIALSVLFLGGVQLLSTGLLGEYIGRIFEEVKARPVAVVRECVGGRLRD